MRLVLSFLMALSAVAVLLLGAAPASAMDGGCHESVATAAGDHGGGHEAPATTDSQMMHCCIACTPQAGLPVASPARLALAAPVAARPFDLLGRSTAPEPDPSRS